ncbi:LCP family protein [Rhodococcoides corynebacterioides]|uniref:LCP family protein n=1 Tax=Rhodococcoides corynebacterioides TaxID=53972 RepID=UPI001C9B48AE|nr:LCP family protein [Rhodococcus corynebacterioides]MBY6361769.1 LCP family protein [Rhodococcus corynebacterioides]
MGDDDETRAPGAGRRAPWERPISRLHDPDSAPGAPSESAPHGEPATDDPAPTGPDMPETAGADRTDDADARLSVAELVDKVARITSRRRDGGSEDAPTPTPPPAPTPPPPTENEADPAVENRPDPGGANQPDPSGEDDPTVVLPAAAPPRKGPEAVGPVAPPALTRLALSKARKRARMRLAGRVSVALVSVLALLLTGIVWGYLRATDRGFAQVSALDTESTDVVDAPGQYGDETYLIVGTDTRAGASGEVGAGSELDAEGARSDTVILINIPADRSRVVAVSFPRDLDVTRPECQAWDSTTGDYTDEVYPAADGDKLNATYALGGPKCLVKVIQKMSGLRIGHFVGIDFAGFESMVDEVGGVDVCTTQPLIDDELGTILPTTGEQRVDGRTALNYVRARKVEAEGTGDYGRIKRQQVFLSSLLRSVLSNRVLFDPGKLNGFVTAFTRDTFVENVKTADLLMLGKSLRGVDAGAVTFLTVPTAGTTYYGNEIPRTDDIDAIFRAVIDDQPLPGEQRAPEASPTPEDTRAVATTPQIALDPTAVSVQVSNGSEIGGLAATTAESLAAYGFQIVGTGNADTTTTGPTVVRYGPGSIAEAATVASTLPGAVLEETTSLGGIVEVVLGSADTGTVTAPTPVGETLPTFDTAVAGAPTDVALPSDLTVTNAADATCM